MTLHVSQFVIFGRRHFPVWFVGNFAKFPAVKVEQFIRTAMTGSDFYPLANSAQSLL